jgi:hypothetical protein
MGLFRRVRVPWPDLGALALLVGAAAWLFRLHLTGRVLFIGNSDRLDSMLNLLSFYTDNLRRGRLAAWDETMFAGFNAVALPFTFPSPLVLLESLGGRENLFFVAGVGSCLLLAGAGCAAYAFIQDVCGHRFASLVGAVLYQFTALTTLKVSQNDMSFAVLIVIPLMMLLLRRLRPGSAARCFFGLAVLFACLLTFMFLQKAAYALILGGGYAAYLAVSRRDWRPVVVAGAAFLVGLVVAFPRIRTVGEEMLLSQRRETAHTYRSAAEYYRGHIAGPFPPWSALRWLDDGLFGRFQGEGVRGGNYFNLNEGMLLYSSAFAVFLLAAGAVRFRGRWFGLLLFREQDLSYLFYFLLFGVAVLTVPRAHYLVYRLFLRWDFTHPRILVACVLPACTLVAVLLRELVGRRPEGVSPVRAGLTFAATLALAGALVLAGGRLAHAGTRSWIDVSQYLPHTHLLVGPILHVGFALVTFLALCLVRACASNRPGLRWAVGCLLGLLLVLDAAAGADFRVNGPQNRARSCPLGQDNLLLAGPHDFAPPSAAARQAFAERLETARYRSILVGSPRQFPFQSVAHVSQFWGLRLVDGYLSGVPRTLNALPWPVNTYTIRTIAFPSTGALPWHILSLLNVKYAIMASDALCLNRAAAEGGVQREASPADVTILENPLPVTPRYFFAANVEPVPSLEGAVQRLFTGSGPPNVLQTSYAEGLPEPRHFPTTGAVAVYGDGDRVEITVEPAGEPRFLVLNERHHPRWRAWAGSVELPVYRTNAVMRGVLIPPGVSHVSLRFTPFVLSARALPFYGAALLLLGAVAWLFRRWDRVRAAQVAPSPA